MLASATIPEIKTLQLLVMLLERLHHRNLVNLIGYCTDKQGHRSLVYEYMSNGSLSSRLHDKRQKSLSWDERVHIAEDMARGIEYLHKGVADFGLSKEAVYPPTGIRGTLGYVDPDYVRTNSVTLKSDVYSSGVLLFELISGIRPQQGLLEYIKCASVCQEDTKWVQLLDPRLNNNCNMEQLKVIASLAL